MCIIFLSFQAHTRYPLIIAANRDEFYQRPTSPLHFWDDSPDILAGRDLKEMGTWLGMTRTGRFAGLTNYRNPNEAQTGKQSRGHIISEYLTGTAEPERFIGQLQINRDKYRGYNLLVGNPYNLWYYSNIENKPARLDPGIYGLSNHLLDTPWPKIIRGKKAFSACLENETVHPEDLFDVLADAEQAPDEYLPETGVGRDWEKKLSSIFIQTEHYGTRSSYVIFVDNNHNVLFYEKFFADKNIKETCYSFKIEGEKQ